MSHFAKIVNDQVVEVICAEQDFIDNLASSTGEVWIQTSYNTRAGLHLNGGIPLRKNFASVGFSYRSDLDAFIPPQPFDAWILNTDTCVWEPPFPPPDDGKIYDWDGSINNWVDFGFNTD